jgi:hypothetical protein
VILVPNYRFLYLLLVLRGVVNVAVLSVVVVVCYGSNVCNAGLRAEAW